ncbi:glycosyltransferase family 4 protein [Candidatus Bathyarchaeota archaeon]|nr:glycosyltransferase family 4 protein [Candidatus Bathyarchaeota archaeon]
MMKEKKILLLTHEFHRTGAPICLLEIAQILIKKNYKVSIAGPPNGVLRQDFLGLGVQILDVELLNLLYKHANNKWLKFIYLPIRLFINVLLQFQLLYLFLINKPCGIYINSFASRYGAFAAKLSRKKVFWHLHEEVDVSNFIKLFYSRFVNFIADVVIVNSQFLLNAWNFNKKNKKFRIIYNGTSIPQLEEIDHVEKIYDVVFVGRFSQKKGIFDLIKALDLVKKQRVNLKAVFIGNYTNQKETDKINFLIEKYSLNSNIDYYLDENEPKRIIKKSAVLVLPSYQEAFGKVLIEAMSCKTAVISSNVGGAVELIEHGIDGILIDAGDYKSLGENIINLQSNSVLYNQLTSEGYRKVKNEFNLLIFENKISEMVAEFIDC